MVIAFNDFWRKVKRETGGIFQPEKRTIEVHDRMDCLLQDSRKYQNSSVRKQIVASWVEVKSLLNLFNKDGQK